MGALALVLAMALLALPAPADAMLPVVATIAVGTSPHALAVDPGTHAVYVAVDRLPTGASGGTDTIHPVGGAAVAVDPGTHARYLVSSLAGTDGGTLAIEDGGPGGPIAYYPIPSRATGIALESSSHTAYITGAFGADFDGFLQVATVAGPHREALDGRTLWITHAGGVGSPTLDPVRHTLYLLSNYKDAGDSSIEALDTDSLAPGRTVERATISSHDVPDLSGFLTGLGVDPGTGRVFATTSYGRLVSIDRSVQPPRTTSTRIGTLGPLSGGLAVDPASRIVYVVQHAEGAVYAVDEETATVVARAAVGKEPGAVAVDAASHTVYVANQADGSVTVLQGIARTVAPVIRGLPDTGGGGMAPAAGGPVPPPARTMVMAAIGHVPPADPRRRDQARPAARRCRSSVPVGRVSAGVARPAPLVARLAVEARTPVTPP